jgi:hypothetical protein
MTGPRGSGYPRCVTLALAAVVLGAAAAPALAAEPHPLIARKKASERKNFTDAEIVDGFFKVAFGAEFTVAGRIDRIRRYDEPVRVYIDNRAVPDRRAQAAEVIADIGGRIEGLDIATARRRADANVILTLVRDRDLARTMRRLFGRDRARSIQRSLEPQCLSGFRKDDDFRIQHSEVIVVADAGSFIFFDCIYEELLQAIGPINDTDVPWTMFNDDVQMGFFDL